MLGKPFDHDTFLAEVRASLEHTIHRMIDESTDFGALVARHLREDTVVWLTVVTPSGKPLPAPVWFWWDGEATVRVFSLPDTGRVRAIRNNPNVSLNFGGNGHGGDIVILSAEATIGDDSAAVHEPYAEKYASGFERIGVSAEEFAQRYSTPLALRLTKVRGHR